MTANLNLKKISLHLQSSSCLFMHLIVSSKTQQTASINSNVRVLVRVDCVDCDKENWISSVKCQVFFSNNPLTYFPQHFLAKFREIALSGSRETGMFPRKLLGSTNEWREALHVTVTCSCSTTQHKYPAWLESKLLNCQDPERSVTIIFDPW